MKLYEIASEYSEAIKVLEEMLEHGDIDQAVIDDTLTSIKGEFKQKVINIVKYIWSLEMLSEKIKKCVDSMQKRRKSLEKQQDGLKEYLLQNMKLSAQTKIVAPEFVVSVRKCPQSLVVYNQEKLPDEVFKKVTIKELDKIKLKNLIQSGVIVEGARLERSETLSIK